MGIKRISSLSSHWTAGYIPLAIYICGSAVLQVHAIITALLAQLFSKGTAQNIVLLLPEIRLEVFQLKKKKAYKLAENNKVF